MPRATVDSHHIRVLYDELASGYDRRTALSDFLFLKRLRRQLLASAHGRVLEIGIGTGRNLPYYPRDCDITGVDISPKMLEAAAHRAAQLGLKVKLLQMDAHELSFPSSSFDTVVSSLSLCTVIDPVKALSEMSRVSVLNGRILLLEHGRSRYRWVCRVLDLLAPHQIGKYGCHPNRNILALVQAADLVVLQIERHFLGGILQVIRARPPRSGTITK